MAILKPYGHVLLNQRTVTLTNAQILTLKTVGVDVIPAAGPNRVNLPVLTYFDLRQTIDYGNVDGSDCSLMLVNDADGDFDIVTTNAKGLFETPSVRSGFSVAVPLSTISAEQTIAPVYRYQFSNWVNKATQVWIMNSTGNLTGGGVANSLTVTVLYAVYDVEAKRFV